MTPAVRAEARPPASPPLVFWAPVVSLLLAAVVVLSGAGSETVWHLIRASGVVTYLLLSLTVVAGLLISSRSLPSGQPRTDFYEVHNFTSLLVLGFGSFHAAALLFDSFVGFSPREVLIPFTSDYRPLAVGFGGLTLYLSAVIYASFWARRAIGTRAWRVLHYGSFLAFGLATYHGLFAGSDTSADWMLMIYFGAMAFVGGLLMYRILITTEGKRTGSIELIEPLEELATTPEASTDDAPSFGSTTYAMSAPSAPTHHQPTL